MFCIVVVSFFVIVRQVYQTIIIKADSILEYENKLNEHSLTLTISNSAVFELDASHNKSLYLNQNIGLFLERY